MVVVANQLLQIVAFQATGLVFATSAVNSMVYDKRASLEAAAAGMILLSMITVKLSPLMELGHEEANVNVFSDCLDPQIWLNQ